MNNNDLIRRGDVLARKEVITEEFHEHGASMSISHSVVTVDNINAIPAVPQMSAVEYLKQKRRMCETYAPKGGCFEHCDFDDMVGGTEVPCATWAEYNPEEAIAIVQKWAQEHPERSVEDA